MSNQAWNRNRQRDTLRRPQPIGAVSRPAGNINGRLGLTAITPTTTFENHLTVSELAELWHLSRDTIRRLFLKERGVLIIMSATPGRRTYRTLLIPASIAQRVYEKLNGKGGDPTS